jgi:hypothetical protein
MPHFTISGFHVIALVQMIFVATSMLDQSTAGLLTKRESLSLRRGR